MTSRKWQGFKWRLWVDAAVIGAAIALAFMKRDVALGFLIAGLADLTANYATYSAANVRQKNILNRNLSLEKGVRDNAP